MVFSNNIYDTIDELIESSLGDGAGVILVKILENLVGEEVHHVEPPRKPGHNIEKFLNLFSLLSSYVDKYDCENNITKISIMNTHHLLKMSKYILYKFLFTIVISLGEEGDDDENLNKFASHYFNIIIQNIKDSEKNISLTDDKIQEVIKFWKRGKSERRRLSFKGKTSAEKALHKLKRQFNMGKRPVEDDVENEVEFEWESDLKVIGVESGNVPQFEHHATTDLFASGTGEAQGIGQNDTWQDEEED